MVMCLMKGAGGILVENVSKKCNIMCLFKILVNDQLSIVSTEAGRIERAYSGNVRICTLNPLVVIK